MIRSLTDLPEDILLLIVQVGRVNIVDALSLRQTCTYFFQLSEIPAYFRAVAKTLSMIRPLNIPTFRSLPDLSVYELRALCVQHHLTSANLAQDEVKPRRCRICPIPTGKPELETVTNLCVLAGGHYGLLFFKSGLLQVWDFHEEAVPSSTYKATSSCSLVRDNPCEIPAVGVCILSHSFRTLPCDLDYEILPQGALNLALICRPRESNEEDFLYSISIFKLSLSARSIVEVYKAEFRTSRQPLSITIRDGNCVVLYECDELLRLVIVNLEKGSHRVIRTSIPEEQDDPAVLQSSDGSIVIYSSQAEQLSVHVYLSPIGVDGDTSEITAISPDASLDIEYDEDSWCGGGSSWTTSHREDAYRECEVPLTASSLLESSEEDLDAEDEGFLVSVGHLDLESIVQAIRRGGSNISFSPLKRNFQYFESSPFISWDDEALWRASPRGFLICWLGGEPSDNKEPYRMRFCPIGDPTDPRNDRSDLIRTFKLPFDLGYLERVLAFSEDSAALYIVTRACNRRGDCCPRSLRILEF